MRLCEHYASNFYTYEKGVNCVKNISKKIVALICCLALCVSAMAVLALPAAAEGEYFTITEENPVLYVNVEQEIKLCDVSIALDGSEIGEEDAVMPGNEAYWYPSDAEVLIGGGTLTVTAKGAYYVDVEDDWGRYGTVTVVAKNADEAAFELDGESIPVASLPYNPDNYVPTELDPALAVYQSQKIGVMSDIHLQVGATSADYALKAALTSMKEQGVSAVLFTGDMVNTGVAEEYEKFISIWDSVFTDPATAPERLTITGNHEHEGVYFRDMTLDETYATYLNAFGYEEANFHKVVNGIHIIGLNSESHLVDGAYTLDTMMYLEEQLIEAAADDPYAPIIVMCHQTLANTTYGSEWGSSGTSSLNEVLRYYPQVVYLAGHSHFDFTNEKSIMQKYFTAIDVPSMQYTSVENGNGGSSAACYTYQNYLILDVDADTKTMNVKRMKSYETDAATHTYEAVQVKDAWTLNLPLTKKTFTYTAARAEDRVAPQFAADAAVTVDAVTYNSATVTFPAATHNDYVHAYKIDVTDAAGSPLTSTYFASDFYLLNGHKTAYTVDLEGLPCNSKCIINVSALESFGKASAPISVEITTDPITDPSVSQNVADFMDVNIAVGFDDNSPYRRPFNLYAKSQPVKLIWDTYLNRQVATMGGWVNYPVSLGSLQDIENSFSVELAFKTPADLTSEEGQTIFGNRENGGFAAEFTPEGLFQAGAYINGEAKYIQTENLKADTWYYLVLTFDGEKLALYLDNAKVGEVEAAGKMTFDDTITYMAIGADTAANGAGARVFNGCVALARIYTKAMDEAALTAAYASYQNDNAYTRLYRKYLALQKVNTTGMKAEDIAAIEALLAKADALLNSADRTATAATACANEIADLQMKLAAYDVKNALALFNDKFDDFTKVHDMSAEGLQWENNTEIKNTLFSKNKNIDVYVTYKLPGNVQIIELDALSVATEYDFASDFKFFVSEDGKNWVELKYTFDEPQVNALNSYWVETTVKPTLKVDLEGTSYKYLKIQLNEFGTYFDKIQQTDLARCNWSTVLGDLRVWYLEDNSTDVPAEPGEPDKPGQTYPMGEDVTPAVLAALLVMGAAAATFVTSKKRSHN